MQYLADALCVRQRRGQAIRDVQPDRDCGMLSQVFFAGPLHQFCHVGRLGNQGQRSGLNLSQLYQAV